MMKMAKTRVVRQIPRGRRGELKISKKNFLAYIFLLKIIFNVVKNQFCFMELKFEV